MSGIISLVGSTVEAILDITPSAVLLVSAVIFVIGVLAQIVQVFKLSPPDIENIKTNMRATAAVFWKPAKRILAFLLQMVALAAAFAIVTRAEDQTVFEAATALIARVECNVIAGHKSCSEISRPYKPALAIGTAGTGYTPKPVILPRYAAEVAEPFAQPVNLLPDYYDESPPNLGTSEVDAFPDMYGLGTGQPPAATTPEPEVAVPADLLEGIGSPVVPSAEPAAALPG